MADSRRELILKWIKGLLDGSNVPDGLVAGATKPAGLTVHRYRGLPLDSDDLPAQVVYPLQETAQRVGSRTGPLYEEKFIVRVEHRVESSSVSPDEALDPLINWTVQVVGADERLGGLALDVQKKGTVWDPDVPVIRETFGAAATDFEIRHQTRKHNPEEKS